MWLTILPFWTPVPKAPALTEEEEREELRAKLQHYEVPGLLPPGSRVDPRVPQREPGSLISIKSLWRLGWFLAGKCEHTRV